MAHQLQETNRLVDVDAQLVRLLYRNLPTGFAVNLVIASLLVWQLYTHVTHTPLLAWYAAVVLVSSYRLWNYWRFNRQHPEDRDIKRWCFSFMVGTLASAVIWGATPWVLGPFKDVFTPMFIAFALGGLMVGAAAVLGGVLRIYISYTLLIMGPMMLWFMVQPGDWVLGMGLMLIVAMLAMMVNGLVYRRVLRDSIQLSNDLMTAKAMAEQANQAKAQFLSRMSHELRTPVSSILGYAQLVQEQHVRGSQNRGYLDQIVDSTDHLLALIDDLLDLSRIETRNIQLEYETVDAYALLQRCHEQLQPIASQRCVLLGLEARHANLSVRADPRRLELILLSVIANACLLLRGGGRLQLGIELAESQTLRFYVQDLGERIAQDEHQQVFIGRHRLEGEDSTVDQLGLGAMLSHQLIELMGGQLGVSVAGEVAPKFYVQLPLCQSAKGESATHNNIPSSALAETH
jgi:signal transduction histidine kinase